MNPESRLVEDRRAIEALNQHDVKAVLAGDVDAIVSQWTEGFVAISQTVPIVRGRAANAALAEPGREYMRANPPVEYVVDIEEITVAGDYAFEWGTFKAVARAVTGGPNLTYSGKLMRILQRQADGSWKMHRTMTTMDPALQ